MTKYLIPILGLSALLLLHGCATVPESKPRPAAESRAEKVKPPEMVPRAAAVMKPSQAATRPAFIYRITDTGFKSVTDTSDLQSRHRFRLAWHVIEVNSATRYYGGLVADIDVGTRLRAAGVYHNDVIVADAIYIDRPARTPTVSATSAGETGAGKSEQAAATEARVPQRATGPKFEQTNVNTPSANARPAAEQKGGAKVAAPPMMSPPSAKSSTRASSADASFTVTVKVTPPSTQAPEAKLAEAGQHLAPSQPAPSAKEASEKPAGPSTGAGASRDFSHFVFDDRNLPMALDHGWTLDRQRDVVDGATRCVLLSPEFSMFDGYYPAKVWLRVNTVRAWVKTDSNIDTSYPRQGLRVDGGELAPFAEELTDEQTAYTDALVLRRLADGHTLTVTLGFWPTWPKTKTQTANIDLAGSANAYAALQACSQQQQAAASGPASTGSGAQP
ncbi:MAG: hypothetical protein L0H63_15740 [Nitrococcus sp.]|nr:hypothetical protein [Nitrococcus sp.]